MEIKPCPFCGSNNIEVDSYGVIQIRGYDSQDGEVECNDCGACITYTSHDPVFDSASEGAIHKWNRRIV